MHRHVKAELDLNLVKRFDFGVFDRVARLDGAHVVFVVDRFKCDQVGIRMLATDGKRRLLEGRARERFHETLGTHAEDVLVDFVVRHDAAMDGLAHFNVTLKATLVGKSKVRIVRFHAKPRKGRRLDECKANLLDRMGHGLHKLAQEDAIRKRHLEEEIRTRRYRLLDGRLLRHCAGINLLVGHDDALGALRRRSLGCIGLGLLITACNERILFVFRRTIITGLVIHLLALLGRHLLRFGVKNMRKVCIT